MSSVTTCVAIDTMAVPALASVPGGRYALGPRLAAQLAMPIAYLAHRGFDPSPSTFAAGGRHIEDVRQPAHRAPAPPDGWCGEWLGQTLASSDDAIQFGVGLNCWLRGDPLARSSDVPKILRPAFLEEHAVVVRLARREEHVPPVILAALAGFARVALLGGPLVLAPFSLEAERLGYHKL